MSPQNGLLHYQNNGISTSSQGQLILMMYEGALQAVEQALVCMNQKDVSGQSRYILKAQDIINELSLALDMDRGGAVARTLEQLYQFALNQLIQANISSDPVYLESIIKVLTPLREAWEKINQTSPSAEPLPVEASVPSQRYAAPGAGSGAFFAKA